jgi:hypothetical protein
MAGFLALMATSFVGEHHHFLFLFLGPLPIRVFHDRAAFGFSRPSAPQFEI